MHSRTSFSMSVAGLAGTLGLALAASFAPVSDARAQEVASEVAERVDDLRKLAIEATPINDFIYKIEGNGAVFLINTSEGSVLVDTGFEGEQALAQKKLVDELATGPVRKIVVTHAHVDHAGGLPDWQEEIDGGAEFVAHERYGYMSRLQLEPLRFFLRRFAVLYPTQVDPDEPGERLYWKMRPTREVYPGADYTFELGGVEFRVIAPENGGEGEDGLLLWLPQQKILFTGDLFGTLYPMFPNLYTVRGEKYRDLLDYIDALDLVLTLDPEIMVPTHFHVIEGRDYIRKSVKKMRDAVQYVWDETVKGMNEGKTVWQLMEEIELPEELALSQGHGKVSWSVRAAWDILTGWYYYDSVANLYGVPESAVHPDLVELAGGADALAKRARRYLERDEPLEALRLLDVAGGAETKSVLEARIEVLEVLLERARKGARNYSEIGLLEADSRATRAKLGTRD